MLDFPKMMYEFLLPGVFQTSGPSSNDEGFSVLDGDSVNASDGLKAHFGHRLLNFLSPLLPLRLTLSSPSS